MPQPVRVPSFRAFPSQRSWSLSKATSYLAVVLSRSGDVIARGLPADVSPTPASPRLPGSPSTRDALSAEQVQPSRSPQPQATRAVTSREPSLLRSLIPPASPFATTEVAFCRRPLLSWCSSPSETLPSLGASNPSPASRLELRLSPLSRPEGREVGSVGDSWDPQPHGSGASPRRNSPEQLVGRVQLSSELVRATFRRRLLLS